MLSSRKEENLLQSVSPSTSLPTSGSVGKVFNSIQGLQQRLDDFSLEDLSKAIETVKTLSLRLAELQRRLGTIVEIRQLLTATNRAIEHAVIEISDLSTLGTLDKPPDFKENVQDSKLIEFPRPSRLSFDAFPLLSQSTLETDSANDHATDRITAEHSHVIEAPDTATENPQWSIASDPSGFDPGEEWTLESNDFPEPGERPLVEYTQSKPRLTEIPNTHPSNESDDSASAIAEPSAGIPEESPEETLTPALPEAPGEPASRAEDLPTDETAAMEAGEFNTLVPLGPDFDQRLLDDLIKDYGEFASSPNVPATLEPKKETRHSKRNQDRSASTLPEEQPHSPSRHLPSIRKEGEIDRKLKKLIKDYGEYDLYSHQSPVNLKTGVIGAFVLLAVIFAGFYFFSAPEPVASSQPSMRDEPAAISTPSGAEVLNNKTRGAGKIPKGAGGAAVELPRTAEASEQNPGAQKR